MKSKRKTYGELTAAAVELLKSNPNMSTALIADKLNSQGFKTTPSRISTIRWRMRQKGRLPVTSQRTEQPFQLEFKIPEAGAIVKLNGNKGMVGTIMITEDGVTYYKANAKNRESVPVLGWELLNSLFQSGIIK